jgi:hypothetical protein
MGLLMIRCPFTGRPIFTGRYVESAAFSLNPCIFQPDLLSALPHNARVVRERRVGLRFRLFRM